MVTNPENIDRTKNQRKYFSIFPSCTLIALNRSLHSVLNNYTLHVRLQFYKNEFNSLQNLLLFLFVIRNKILTLELILFAKNNNKKVQKEDYSNRAVKAPNSFITVGFIMKFLRLKAILIQI